MDFYKITLPIICFFLFFTLKYVVDWRNEFEVVELCVTALCF